MQGRRDDAVASLRAAAANAPDHPGIAVWLGHALEDTGEAEAASQAYARAHALAPDEPQLAAYLLAWRRKLCDWRDLDALARQVRDAVNAGRASVEPFAFLSEDASAAEQLRCARLRASAVAAARAPAAAAAARSDAAAPIRVGFLSNGFGAHPTGLLTVALFEQLKAQADLEIHLFALNRDDGSPIRQRLARGGACTARRRRCSRTHRSSQAIRDAGIEVLFDLRGWGGGGAPEVLAMRPAPVQVNWLAYPARRARRGSTTCWPIASCCRKRWRATSAKPSPGCRAASSLRTPRARSRRRHRARSAACRIAARDGEGVVFCCFNNSYKLNPRSMARALAVLREVPGSVLWLLSGPGDADARLRDVARTHGVDPQRLVFMAKQPHADYLARLQHADLFLDTEPYNAHTTASDALVGRLPGADAPRRDLRRARRRQPQPPSRHGRDERRRRRGVRRARRRAGTRRAGAGRLEGRAGAAQARQRPVRHDRVRARLCRCGAYDGATPVSPVSRCPPVDSFGRGSGVCGQSEATTQAPSPPSGTFPARGDGNSLPEKGTALPSNRGWVRLAAMTAERDFIPLNLCVLTVSDSRTLADDTSGDYLVQALTDDGHRLADRKLLPDDRYRLRAVVSQWIADDDVDGILVTGGTGFTGRDSTPEALLPLLDKQMPGFGELFRAISFDEIGTSTAAVARVRRPGQRHVRVRPARLDLGLPHRLGKDHPQPARRAHPAVQPGHAASAPEGTLTARPSIGIHHRSQTMPLDTTLQLLARARGLSAADIATAIPRAGVATVSAWLRGEKMPGKEQLDALARTFGVPAGALLAELASTLDPARTQGEHDLLAAYRALNTRQQGALLEVARSMAAPARARRRSK